MVPSHCASRAPARASTYKLANLSNCFSLTNTPLQLDKWTPQLDKQDTQFDKHDSRKPASLTSLTVCLPPRAQAGARTRESTYRTTYLSCRLSRIVANERTATTRTLNGRAFQRSNAAIVRSTMDRAARGRTTEPSHARTSARSYGYRFHRCQRLDADPLFHEGVGSPRPARSVDDHDNHQERAGHHASDPQDRLQRERRNARSVANASKLTPSEVRGLFPYKRREALKQPER